MFLFFCSWFEVSLCPIDFDVCSHHIYKFNRPSLSFSSKNNPTPPTYTSLHTNNHPKQTQHKKTQQSVNPHANQSNINSTKMGIKSPVKNPNDRPRKIKTDYVNPPNVVVPRVKLRIGKRKLRYMPRRSERRRGRGRRVSFCYLLFLLLWRVCLGGVDVLGYYNDPTFPSPPPLDVLFIPVYTQPMITHTYYYHASLPPLI